MFTSSILKLFRKATRSKRSGRGVSLTKKSDSRRLAVAWFWLAGIFAIALIGAACDDFTSDTTESPVAPAPTPVIELARTATPTPAATAPPVLSPTAAPSAPTGAAGDPSCVLDPPELDHPTISASDEAWRFLFDLTREFSPRESATDEEYAAGEELNCVLKDIGYITEFQDFQRLVNTVSSVVVGPEAPAGLEAIQSLPITDSFEGEATGELVFVGLALESDVGEQRFDGKVALIERGAITFQEKVERVEAAGAVGAVIFNSEDALFSGVMVTPDDVPGIPAIGISRGNGLALQEAIESGGLEVTVGVETFYQPSRNLIAEKPGGPDRHGVVIVGAHYDTVHLTEGANDNGSGLTALMAIANNIIETDYPFTVRLLLFGSQEVGLLGSRHYVEQLTEEERSEIIAMINYESVGSGTRVEVRGDEELTGAAMSAAEQMDITLAGYLTRHISNSDHRPFDDAGVPVIIITADDVSRINSPRDTLEFVDSQLVVWAADIGIGILDHLAETQRN